MMECEFEALLELIDALMTCRESDVTEDRSRYLELKQAFINVHIFGDAPDG